MSSTMVYIPPSLSKNLTSPLSQLRLIGLSPGPCAQDSNPKAKTNHWVLHLITVQNTIELDFNPTGASDGSSTLIIGAKTAFDFEVDEVAKSCVFGVREGTTVKDIIDRITDAGLTRYLFSEGQGCRYWASRVLRLLHDEDILLEPVDGGAGPQKGSVESGIDVLTKVWHREEMVEAGEQSGIVEGTFY